MPRAISEQAPGDAPDAAAVRPKPAAQPLRTQLTPTLFHEDWWLRAATNNTVEVAEISSGGRTVGRLPYVVRKRSFYSEVRVPPLTYFLGPAIDEGEGSENNRFLKRL